MPMPTTSPMPVTAAGPAPPPFCSGMGMAMHMDGLELFPTHCINLLLGSWKLDSPLKFYGAVAGTAVFALLFEVATWVRRTLHARQVAEPRATKWRVATALLYTVQVLWGYLLMLITMTYQIELLLAVVLGLGGGHAALNWSEPPGNGAVLCHPDDEEAGISRRSTKASLMEPLLSGGAGRAGAPPLPAQGGGPGGARSGTASGTRTTLRIEGMTCGGCAARVERALRAVPGVADARVDLEAHLATVTGGAGAAALLAAVEAAGKRGVVLGAAVGEAPGYRQCAYCIHRRLT